MCIHGKNMWRFGISLTRGSFLQEGESIRKEYAIVSQEVAPHHFLAHSPYPTDVQTKFHDKIVTTKGNLSDTRSAADFFQRRRFLLCVGRWMTKRLHFLFQCSLHGLQLPKLLCLTMHFSKTLQGVQIHSFHDQRKVLLRFSSRTSCIFSNKMNAGMGCFLDYIEGIHFLVLKVVVSQ